VLINQTDTEVNGAGETSITVTAPAIANASSTQLAPAFASAVYTCAREGGARRPHVAARADVD